MGVGLLILLAVDDVTRMQRLVTRGDGWSAAEERQSNDPDLAARIQAAYRRIEVKGTTVVELDASGSREQLLQEALAHIKMYKSRLGAELNK